ncbi:hypothetical protein ACFOON_15160 [Novosphingobium piscinae]|uniref:Uncharacterized protein n=1 Tax=Novosphingobium piscinae TaxID=1507448 RepID=A0A7X1FXK7_9SPHN|nr:hypothetical protein [Novosphingobium piscinae]MBC2668761.1 hypothetical protein [Novosphingobium piscinae]
MNFLPTISEALTTVDQFLILHAAALPQGPKDALLASGSKVSPVDKLVEVAEVLYAARGDLDEDGLTIAGQIAEFCTRNGWHGLADDARGERMVAAIRRDLGEPHPSGGQWPAPETDPLPKGASTAAQVPPYLPQGS